MKQTPLDPAVIYGQEYYEHMCAVPYDRDQPVWRDHFRTFAHTLVERYHPNSVMDIGCAKGFLVEHLRDLSVNAFGVDVSPYAISQAREDIRPFCRVACGNDPLEGRFDLITCIEVAEHMVETDACSMIEEICRHTDQVIFSSTPDDFAEPTHINIHPPEYWIEQFLRQGFYRDGNFQPDFITPQAMRLLRCKKPTLQVAVFSHEPPNCAVALLRLAGTIRHLERRNRLRLQWYTARDPQLDAEKLLNCDLFVVHREFADQAIRRNVMAAARALGKPVVFELDDLLINVPKSNPNQKYCAAITPHILSMLCEADFVTVTTEPLRRYLEEAEPMAKGKTYVLPNYINLDIWDGAKPPPTKLPKPFVIGWFGTATHDEDLAIIKPAILELARKYAGKLVFKFWGYLPKDLEGIPGVQLVRGSQPDLRLHARDVVNSRIDLALAPLLDHPFNHAKSDLKWLEYSICYIPAIYSTISPYASSVKHGQTGWLVDNQPELWIEAIELLMRDHELRRKIAMQSHNEVRQTRCVKTGAEFWDALYRSFHVSGPKPHPAETQAVAAPRDRAAAHLMLHQASALSKNGQSVEAAKICEQAIAKYLPADSMVGEMVNTVLRNYQKVFGEMQETTDLTARLNAAKSVASAGQTRVAVQLYLQTLQAAKQSHNALIVFRAVLEVARALRTLNPELGRPLLDLGATLSRNLPIQEGVRAIEQLRADYGPVSQSTRPQKQVQPANVFPKAPAEILSTNTGKSSSDTSNTLQPAVSIVIPTFNSLSLTQACLQSLAQTRTALQYEIIVVDNASTDTTPEFLREQEKAGNFRLIANSTNQGFAHACNQGATAARGRHVLFLNNDTQPTPGWLDPLVRTADADPKVAAVGAKLIFPDSTIQHAGVVITDDRRHGDSLLAQHIFYRRPQDFPEANEARTYQALTAACLLVRRETFQKLGGFDEEFWNGYEDVDLCFRISAVGGMLVYQPESVVIHHESKGGPERFRNAQQNIARLHAKWQGKIEPDFVVNSDGQAAQVGTAKITRYQIPSVAANQPPRLASIVILAFNQLEHTRKCVASVLAHTRAPFEVIFVDNASTDGTAEYLAGLCRQHSNFKVITNRKNLGFAAGNNQGLAVAKGDVLILLNNDTIVTPGWLEGLTATLRAESSVGLAGPVSNRISGLQLIPADYANDNAMFEFAKSWAAQNAGRTQPVARLVGFCLAFKRAVLDAIGGLDESFGSGNFEDDDYCLRARFAGFGSRIARGVFIHHTGSQTFKGAQINYRQLMLRNWDLFRTKWQLPADASLERGYPIPPTKPETVSLHIALPSLDLTHRMDGQIFRTEEAPAQTTRKAEVPPVARLGNLDKARSLFGQRQFESAWNEVIAALNVRPFHPEAFLLLAEIAFAASDANSARKCAQRAHDFAPGWDAPKQFLKKVESGRRKAENNALAPRFAGDISRFTLPASRLSVCLIVKNEEKFLSQCLKSIRDLASQIVVVDTGSTDRTVEIAKEYAAEIYSTVWSDDFSAARNAALECATGDWVLMLDADEELPADQYTNLRNDMKQADAVAFRLPLVNRGKEGQGHSYVPRLFRNLPGAYYYGRIHEQVFPSLITASKGWGITTRLGSAQILHHGYAGEVIQDRNKIERNLRLLRQAVEEYPDDANLAMNLGLELVHSGDLATGLKHYRDAFRLMSAQLPGGVVPELREVLLTQLTCHLYQARAHDEIVQTLSSPLAKHGGLTASLHFALALAHFELKQFREAAEHIRRCLATRGQPTFAPLNSDILTAAPHHCLALALARSGDNAEAEKSFQAGLKEKGRIEELRLDYAKFLTDQGRPVEALHQLHEIVHHQPQHAAAWRFGGEIALSKPEFLEFARDWTSEAIRSLPDEGVIVAQRAEALMLSQDTMAALPLWSRAINGQRPPQALAARIICATAGSQPVECLQDHAEETAVSQAFVNWYRRLVTTGARDTIFRLNSQVEILRPVLPSAATVLDGVIASMRKNNIAEPVVS